MSTKLDKNVKVPEYDVLSEGYDPAKIRKKESIQGKPISPLVFINRIHALEGIIFELKEVLKTIASYDKDSKHGEGICPYGCDCPNIAGEILKKHNKSWTELYDKIDSEAAEAGMERMGYEKK